MDHPSRHWAPTKTPTSGSVVARSSCITAAVHLVVILESRDAPASFRLQLVDLLPLSPVDLAQLENINEADDVIGQCDRLTKATKRACRCEETARASREVLWLEDLVLVCAVLQYCDIVRLVGRHVDRQASDTLRNGDLRKWWQ